MGLGLLCALMGAEAHAPFDSNARVIVLPDRIEATIIAGTGLAKELIQATGIDPTRGSGVGPAKLLPLEVGPRLFELEVNRQLVAAQSVRIMSDGLEATLFVCFPRPASGPVSLSANYTKYLPAGAASPLFVTDEQGAILASHIVSVTNLTAGFDLQPAGTASVVIAATEAPAPESATAPALPSSTPGANPDRGTGNRRVVPLPLALVALVLTGLAAGWWAKRSFLS
jgi:hypothetical protein